jgi:hypothetical protein
LAGVAVGGEEAEGVGLVGGERFFDEDVEAGVERGDAEGDVVEVGRGDEDGVNFAGGEEGGDAGERAGIGECGEFFGTAVADGGEAQARGLAFGDIAGMDGAHATHADDAETDLLHVMDGKWKMKDGTGRVGARGSLAEKGVAWGHGGGKEDCGMFRARVVR